MLSGHLWVRKLDEHSVMIGITDVLLESEGMVLYVDLPEIGYVYGVGEIFAEMETVGSLIDLRMPLSGTIRTVNSILFKNPEFLNLYPYEQGWLLTMEMQKPVEWDGLMDE